jgi:hypothetical protein
VEAAATRLTIPAPQTLSTGNLSNMSNPVPQVPTKALGIHASDVIIRSALILGLQDLRDNPRLLDFIHAGLVQDSMTWKDQGQADADKAREWFLKTNVNIVLTPNLNEAQLPVITIGLLDSTEVTPEATLGDVHWETSEDDPLSWPILYGPMNPSSYKQATGVMTFREVLAIAPGMVVTDSSGQPHEILTVIDDYSFTIAANTVADFRGATIRPEGSGSAIGLESSSFRESYRLGIHVDSEPVYLTWLHSAVVFVLLRYKQLLLEGRGFERSTLASTDFVREQQFETEMVFNRYVNVSGYVRQYWPKVFATKIGVLQPQIQVGEDRTSVQDAGVESSTQLWKGISDPLE